MSRNLPSKHDYFWVQDKQDRKSENIGPIGDIKVVISICHIKERGQIDRIITKSTSKSFFCGFGGALSRLEHSDLTSNGNPE